MQNIYSILCAQIYINRIFAIDIYKTVLPDEVTGKTADGPSPSGNRFV